MAVIVKDPNAIQGSTGFIGNVVDFFRGSWKFILVAAILVILFVIIWYLLKKIEEERHEREEPGYQLFKTVKTSCILNANKSLICRKWNPTSLFLIFIPVIGWFLIPFIKKDHSSKLIDYNGQLLGFYRGEYRGMDDTTNYLVYQSKKFIFFEDLFVIKVPNKLRMKTKKRDKKGDLIFDTKKKPILIDKNINLHNMVKLLPNGDIKIYCISLERIGLYYYCPVFLMDKGEGVLDYRQIVEGAVVDNTYQIMVQRLLNTASQAMEKGMLLNPNLKYAQMEPEKTKEEQKMDGGND